MAVEFQQQKRPYADLANYADLSPALKPSARLAESASWQLNFKQTKNAHTPISPITRIFRRRRSHPRD
jgi:hypothetical protein